MINNNNNNGDEDEDDADEQQQQVEQQRAEAEVEAAAETQKEERMELISVVLEKKKKVPKRTRNKIDLLVEKFLQDLEDDIHSMLCDTDENVNSDDTDENVNSDIYRGLDSNRDTMAEVETAIRFFPDVLSRKAWFPKRRWRNARYGYPIQCILHIKAIPFTSVLARLAIEFGLFEEQYRGGLICQGVYQSDANRTVLQCLMYAIGTITGLGSHSQEHHELVDNVYLDVMKELKEKGLMVKEDILRYELFQELLVKNYNYFAMERFRFLVEWDPTALTQTNDYRALPLHFAVMSPIQAFCVTFEAGIRYFPKKKGISLLFYKTEGDDTPFQDFCNVHPREKVLKIIEDTLTYYHSDTPLNIADTLLSAAIDDSIHLDCVYFLLRRQPDVLQKLLSAKAETAEATVTADGYEDNNSKVIRKRKRNL
jgi:hypothetical protein